MMVQEIVLESEDSRAKVLEKLLIGWAGWRCDNGENDGGENRQSRKKFTTRGRSIRVWMLYVPRALRIPNCHPKKLCPKPTARFRNQHRENIFFDFSSRFFAASHWMEL